tara:strand:- start:86 stop:859 length:774 start_codon:yes stop_codon:yes gene_type:complete
MALTHSPLLVTDKLEVCIDAVNVKSYSGSGTSVIDISRHGRDATLVNGAAINTGFDGVVSFVFDGTNDHATFSTSINSVISQHKDCSFSVWVRVHDNADNTIIAHPNLTGNAPFILWYDFEQTGTVSNTGGSDIGGGTDKVLSVMVTDSGAEFRFTTEDNVLQNMNGLLPWYNICVVLDPSNNKFYTYVNGKLKALFNSSSCDGIKSSSSDFDLGSGTTGGSSTLNGNIALFSVYSKALSETEVIQNYNALKGRFGI